MMGRIESATSHVELAELEALARAFGLSVAELCLPDVCTRNGEEGHKRSCPARNRRDCLIAKKTPGQNKLPRANLL